MDLSKLNELKLQVKPKKQMPQNSLMSTLEIIIGIVVAPKK